MKATFKSLKTLVIFTLINFTSQAQLTSETIDIDGVSRTYYKYLPSGYDPVTEEVPIVFLLHGIGDQASNAAGYGFNLIADTARFIAIYPQGASNGSQTSWNNGTLLASTVNDVLFISRLIDTVNANHNVNLARVYVSGISMGSIMTYTLCNQLSDRIAAVACHIGTMSSSDHSSFNPTYPVPTLHSHGTADGTVPYSGTALPSLTLVQPTLEKLKATNGFQGDSTIYPVADNANDGITVDRIVYNCTTPLEHWKWNNADHILLYQPVNDTTALMYSWVFFSQFTHPNPSTASVDEMSSIEAKTFPNPLSDDLQILNYDQFKSLEIYSLDGKHIRSERITKGTINFSDLESGTYLFQFTDIHGYISTQRILVE